MMEFFTESQWENSHPYAMADQQHAGIDPEMTDNAQLSLSNDHDSQQLQPKDCFHLESSHDKDFPHYAHNMSQQDHHSQQYHDMLLNDQFLSPEISLHNTPLLSPHALTPMPTSVPQDFKMPPAAVSSSHLTPHRRLSGKVTKQSPPMRWRSSSLPEDEFHLGDAALEEPISAATIMDLTPQPQDDLDERLRNAIAATTASSQSSSRRTSSVGSSSTRVTPRIRPRLGSSADPSPLLTPHNPTTNGSAAVEDDIDHAFLKSNYRNLIDGTHKHLNFPAADRLTSELRAKKTVHKIAEQERRNRMNVAISELSNVIGSQGDNSGASKAATVEKATQYIRKLVDRIHELEQQVKKLEQPESTSSSSPKS